ncbi:hypothetical protein JOB18_040888 [Solea senegalensis]|uniref:Uncharacterized protein n=1 Tax=Solea senegalensis TaxID=28829 RepID=A0AAV6RDR2_SOLSE|nr:hypothetical protein JOB18_040888 [Solea senegalensis]
MRNIMVDLDKNEAVETRKACVLKALMVYLNEDPENRIREYMKLKMCLVCVLVESGC